ncbi:25578_t:CDS:1, partial [Gigaspora margarita]
SPPSAHNPHRDTPNPPQPVLGSTEIPQLVITDPCEIPRHINILSTRHKFGPTLGQR